MKGKCVFFFSMFLMVATIAGQDHQRETVISVPQTPEIRQILTMKGMDLLMEHQNRIFILAGTQDLMELERNHIEYRFEHHLFEQTLQEKAFPQESINGAYHTYAEMEQALMDLGQNYPGLALVRDIGDTVENRNIYALKISDLPEEEENEPAVLILGCHHAREWISVEVPLLFGKYLLENYAIDPEIKNLVDHCVIWIIPMVNPDGLEYSIHTYRYWRKNRRANADGSFGVDLNRNYGYKWGMDDIGSSPYPGSGLYRGPAPFSEPEAAAIRDFMPGKRIKALISYHSFGQVILYPWGHTSQAAKDKDLLNQLALDMAELMQEVNGNSYPFGQAGLSLYISNGTTTDWSYGVYGIPSFTFELPPINFWDGGFINSEDDIQFIFNENLPALLYLTNWTKNQSSVNK